MANIVTYEARDGQDVELNFDTIKRYLVTGKPEFVTNQEMIFFIGICKARGLNPFAKDCYLIKYTERDPAAIITSIDYFRARARAQKDCRGWNAGIIVEDQDGNTRYSKGLIRKDETLLGGWFKGRPHGWDYDFELEVNLDGYIKKTKEGKTTQFWRKEMQPTMIRKVAESQGLRELWPDEFAKLYVEEEIDRSEMMDVTPRKPAIPEKPDLKPGEDPYKAQDIAPIVTQDAPGEEKPESEVEITGESERAKRKRNKKKSPQNPPAEEVEDLTVEEMTEEEFLRVCKGYEDELGLPKFNLVLMAPPFLSKDRKDIAPDQWHGFLQACSRKLDEINAQG